MSEIPQVTTENYREVCEFLKWGVDGLGILIYVCTDLRNGVIIGTNNIERERAVANALNRKWHTLAATTKARIRAICAQEGTSAGKEER